MILLTDKIRKQFLMDGMAQLYKRQDLPLKDALGNLNLQPQKNTVAGSPQLFLEKTVSTKLIQRRENHHQTMRKQERHHFSQGGIVLPGKMDG